MLASFLTVSQQVIILFLLIGVGFVCGKTKFLADTAVTGMTDFVLYIVTPCVMIQSLQREFDAALAGAFLQAVLFAVITTFIGYFLARRTLHDQQPEREIVYRFSAIFSNCGFMALPLESALLGPDGMFFGAAFLAVFNIMNWTLGLYMMSRNRQLLSLRKLITNPGIIGVTIGVILFFTSSTLPTLVNTPVDYLAGRHRLPPVSCKAFHCFPGFPRLAYHCRTADPPAADRFGVGHRDRYGSHSSYRLHGCPVCPGCRKLHHVLRDLRAGFGIVRFSGIFEHITLHSHHAGYDRPYADAAGSAVNFSPAIYRKSQSCRQFVRSFGFFYLNPTHSTVAKRPHRFQFTVFFGITGDTVQHPAPAFPAQLSKGIAAVLLCPFTAKGLLFPKIHPAVLFILDLNKHIVHIR